MQPARKGSICAGLVGSLAGCPDDDELRSCGREFDESDIVVVVESGDLTSSAVGGDLQVDGSVVASARIDRLLIGSIRAEGKSSNFRRWTAKVPQAVLQAYRTGEHAAVPVVAFDICGNEYEQDRICVRVNAPPQTTASCLGLSVQPGVAGECYIPTDGSATALVELSGRSTDAGVGVKMSSAVDGDFLDVANGMAVLRAVDDAHCEVDGVDSTSGGSTSGGGSMSSDPACEGARDSVQFRAKAAGELNIVAVSGNTIEFDASGLIAAGPPAFAGASGAVEKGITHPSTVTTGGRLRSCTIFQTTDNVTVTRNGNLLDESEVTFDNPNCRQTVRFAVNFGLAAATGTTVIIACRDTYGQEGRVEFIASE